jgi:DNA polymerase
LGTVATGYRRRVALGQLREDAKDCRACPLWERATQTVFGEGPDDARVVMVGEQPGDREDLEGRPFVGPAGAVLDRALAEAGFDRGDVYVTNAVKHFKWKERGKRRIHDKPSWSEVTACSPWLRSELGEIRPELVVCLGATAAQALLGKHVRVLRDRGRALEAEFADHALVTIHPSAVLRADEQARAESYAGLLADLRIARSLVAEP